MQKVQIEIEAELRENILASWYPKCIDYDFGGYLSSFSPEFAMTEDQDKMIVTQARHMWSNAMAHLRYPDEKFNEYALHGLGFLKDKMWDIEYGGFYQLVDRSGIPIDQEGLKTAYGNAFGIYGLSALFRATGDSLALDLAIDTFHWLEEHSHDPVSLGYFQHLTRQGSVVDRPDTIVSTSDIGYKDQNSSIHLLEAFTELYKVWPDPLLRQRLTEIFFLIRDTIVNESHYMDLFFTPDWEPISFDSLSREEIIRHFYLDHVSFGHDIETAYLLLEASEILDLEHEETLDITYKMVDHAIKYGWDGKNGGLYDGGYYFRGDTSPEIVKETKSWWSQAEALNTLLLFHTHFPEESFDSLFLSQWKYIKQNLVDTEYGGWYANGLDTDPLAKTYLKGQIWKSSYHNYRALANSIEMLNEDF